MKGVLLRFARALALLGFPLVFLFFVAPLMNGGRGDVARFALFALVWVVLPASAYGRAAFPRAPIEAQATLGIPVAYAVVVLLAAIGARLNVPSISVTLPPLGALLLLRRARPQDQAKQRATWPFAALHALLGGASMITLLLMFGIPQREPIQGELGLHYQDVLWTIGNTKSILQFGLPLRLLQYQGVPYGYHTAQNLLHVAAHNSVELSPIALMLRLEPFFTVYSFVGVLVWGGAVIVRAEWPRALLVSTAIIFAGGLAVGEGSFNLSNFWDPISYAFGLGAFALVVYSLFAWLDDLERPPVLFVALCFALAVASKGVLLFLVLMPLLMVFGLDVVMRRASVLSIVRRFGWLGLGLFFAGILVWLLLFWAPGSGPILDTYPVPLGGRVARLLLERRLLGDLGELVFAVYAKVGPLLWGAGRFFLGALPVAAVFVWRLVASRRGRVGYWSLGSVRYADLFAACAVVIISFVNFRGGVSYFFWYSQVAACLVFVVLPRLGMSVAAVVVAVFCGVLLQVGNVRGLAGTWAASPAGRVVWDVHATLDRGEWDGALWLGRVAAPRDLFLGNRFGYRHELTGDVVYRFVGFSSLSGVVSLVEGAGFLSRTHEQEAEALQQEVLRRRSSSGFSGFLRERGVRWYVESKRFGDALEWPDPDLRVVFENESVRIFEVVRVGG